MVLDMNVTRRCFLKAAGLAGLGTFFAHNPTARSQGPTVAVERQPNIIFVLADDLGWSELGCYGNTFNETPHLDRLARDGMMFTNAYAAAPVCSPYRVALMTGLYPARTGITDYLRPDDPKHLPTQYVTLPERLKDAGYATGIVGKWHLTGYANHNATEVGPGEHGFDEVIVSENRGIGGGSYFHPYHFNQEIQTRLGPKEYLVDRCNLEAIEFIERHKDEPFFLYLSHYAVHTRLAGKPDLVAKYENKPGAGKGPNAGRNNPHLAAQLESIDLGIGMIREKLHDLGLAETTLIIFTSDNGGEDRVTSNAPLRAGKSTLYEGGLRVPLIVSCPALTTPATICDKLVCTMDFYPTLLECAGPKGRTAPTVDGISLVPLLKDPQADVGSRTLYWHYPLAKPHFLGGRSAGAIRQDAWKLIHFFDTGRTELYDLASDPAEQNDLAAHRPAKKRRLLHSLETWQRQVGAIVPDDQHKPA